jgi:hypothetical protein
VDESGTTSLRVFMEGMAKRPFSSINARGQALRDAFSIDSIAQGKAIISAFERPGMDAKKQDMLTRYIGSKQGDKEFRGDAIPDIASFLSEAKPDIAEDDFRKRADEIAKQGRTPTDAQAYSDTAASSESGKLQTGWELRYGILKLKELGDASWHAAATAFQAASSTEEFGKAVDKASNALLEFLNINKKEDSMFDQYRRGWSSGGLDKMSYPGDMMDRGLLQSAAVGQMMMVSMRGGMPGVGGLMHAAFSGMPSGGRSGGGGRTGGKVGDLGGGQAWLDYLNKLEDEGGLPSGLLGATQSAESEGRDNLTSPKGARGPMQFMPGTWDRFGKGKNIWDRHDAAEAARDYYVAIRKSLKAQGVEPTTENMVASYNAGEGAVGKHGGFDNLIRKGWKETRGYVPKVMDRMKLFDKDGRQSTPPAPDLPPTPPPTQSAPVPISGDAVITLNFKDKEGNPVTTDPPKTIVRLRTRGLAPNAPLGWA